MREQRQVHCAGLWLAASAPASMAAPAAATDLVDAWRPAQQHDLDFAVSRAAQQAGDARLGQAGALWRPNVTLSGTAGVAGSDTAINGAQFSAPGLGTSEGVAFNTSVNRGTLGRWALGAAPVTDIHEAAARAEAITAPGLALETDLQLKQAAFTDATGLQPGHSKNLLPVRRCFFMTTACR